MGSAVSMVGWAWIVPVGVQGIGWNGVGVGEAFGAAVTRVKGRAGWTLEGASARGLHPARRQTARSRTEKSRLMTYGLGVSGVSCITVGGGNSVSVGGAVVTVGRGTCVSVGKVGMIVTPGTGVRVGMFGTQSRWPV